MTNTRPRSRNKPSRRERRTAAPSRATQPREAVKVYSTPTSASAAPAATAPRRTYLAEPAPIDYSSEYRFIRHDLKRIFIWAGLLLIVMFALWFLPVL